MERRRGKQKRQQDITENPTKIETAVAKHLRFNVPTKQGKLAGMPVPYFFAKDAVDCLLDSKWAASKTKTNALFTNRSSCVDFCHSLLLKGMFHRAGRLERRKEKDRGDKKRKKLKDDTDDSTRKDEEKGKKEKKEEEKTKKEKKEEDKSKKEKKIEEKSRKDKKSRRKEKAESLEDSEEEKKSEKDGDNDKDEKKEDEKKKKKKEKKVKLEMVDHQYFKDGEEIYVWIYDPVPLKTFIIGLFLVLGSIAVCLFPLWPPEVRLGVYYISLTVAIFIGFLLSLCVVRVIIFAFVWVFTFGHHHFWLLPNLNEDVGFFESFQPLYHHEFKKNEDKTEEDTDKKEEDVDKKDKNDDTKQKIEQESLKNKDHDDDGENIGEEDSGTSSELDNDNGYEIVTHDELTPEEDFEVKKTK